MTHDDFYEAIELVDTLIEDIKKLKGVGIIINQNLSDRALCAKIELIEKYISGEVETAKSETEE